MNCPHCHSTHSYVVKGGSILKGGIVTRVRTCEVCGKSFRTMEILTSSIHRLHELLRARRDADSQITDLIGQLRLRPTQKDAT